MYCEPVFGQFRTTVLFQVVQAKVVASAKNPDSKRYYGIVTMSTSEEADRCIENLNQTEVNGQVITVEKVKRFIGLILEFCVRGKCCLKSCLFLPSV